MDYSKRLAISYYSTVAVINDEHKIYLVQHQQNKHFFVKKVLDVYNPSIYEYLCTHHVKGTPHIIDYCEDNGELIVIEEYISGCTLAEKIAETALNEIDIKRYILELCHILANLHSLNPPVIHRDIKPSNIIITNDDDVVLLDFNAAKRYSPEESSDTMLLGTHGYAAPEQYGFGSSSPQTDIYSIGILLKELSGDNHFFDDIISKCTQINPADRYRNISELVNALTGQNSQDTHTANINTTNIPSAISLDVTNLAADTPATTIKNTTNIHAASIPAATIPADSIVSRENAATHQPADKPAFSIKDLIPPGYRTKTPWKMLVATTVYAFIILVSSSLVFENITGPSLILYRLFAFSIFIIPVFSIFNYMNICNYFPLCNSSNLIVKIFGIALLSTALFFLNLIIVLTVDSLIL